MELEVLFEDEDVLVCYKPAGVATQTAKMTEPDMVSMIRNYRVAKGESDYVGVIHRLDQPVEGVLVFAKNAAAAAILGKELKARQFAKYYYAIVTRENIPETGVLEDYVVKDGRKNRAMVVTESNPRAKKARLSYEVVKRLDDRSFPPDPRTTGKPYGTDLRRCQIRWQPYRRTALSLLLPPAVYASGQRGGHGFFHQASWQRVR